MKVGIIGLGKIAHKIYFPILNKYQNQIDISVVMSRTIESVERTKNIYNIKKGTNSFEEFLDQKVDSVFILTPKETRKDYIIPLLKKGINIYCEKPMAGNIEEAQEILKVAKESSSKLMFAFNRRFMDIYKRAKEEFVDSSPGLILCRKNRPGQDYRATLENTIHMIDLISWFCGEPEYVSARAKYKDEYYETGFSALLQFGSGALGIISASREGGQWEELVEIHGNGKTIHIAAPNTVTVTKNGESSGYSYIGKNTGFVDANEFLGFDRAVQHFFDCIRDGRQALTNAESVFKTQRLLDLLLRESGLPLA